MVWYDMATQRTEENFQMKIGHLHTYCMVYVLHGVYIAWCMYYMVYILHGVHVYFKDRPGDTSSRVHPLRMAYLGAHRT